MAKTQTGEQRLITVVAGNDRLLKALVTLLAIRDPVLMEELTIMFGADAEQLHADTGRDRAVSAYLRAELEKLSALAEHSAPAEEDEISSVRLS